MKTTTTTKDTIKRSWHLIDLKDQTLGRVSTQIAKLLIGKHKPYFTPNLDCGDYVVVINADDVQVTGKKATDKIYRHHTGFPDGFREYTYNQMMKKDPKQIIQLAIKGMLPKNKLRAPRLNRLKIFTNNQHPYTEQIENSLKKDA